MRKFIKACRKNAGLSQEQLAEKMGVSVVSVQNWESGKTNIEMRRYTELSAVFNVPVEKLIKEMLIEEDKKRPDRWPGFLFHDDTNAIIDTLHLNLAQQDLFGLLYIYDAEYLKKTMIDFNTIYDDLRKIPYGFIEKVGSIQFMNQVDGLHDVIKYIRTEFLMKVLKQNPESEFNVKKLSKELICEFIDEGVKPADNMAEWGNDSKRYEAGDSLYMPISMKKAKMILPVLEKGEIRFNDGHWTNPPGEDAPEEEILMHGFKSDLWREGYYSKLISPYAILGGLKIVTDYRPISGRKADDKWFLEINDRGRQLLEWFREQ